MAPRNVEALTDALDIGDVTGGNYLSIDPSGDVRLYGDGTLTVDTDLSVPSIDSVANLSLMPDAGGNVYLFENAASGETPELRVYGRKAGGSLDYASMAMSSVTDGHFEFTGASQYNFSTDVYVTGDLISNGNSPLTSSFVVETVFGTNTNTVILVRGKGTGYGDLRAYDQDNGEYASVRCVSGQGYLDTAGVAPGALNLQSGAHADVKCFVNSASGETRQLYLYGNKSGTLRSLQIGCDIDAEDQASFDGVAAYWFDGKVKATTMNISSLPTSDPSVAGELWNDSGTVKVSAG